MRPSATTVTIAVTIARSDLLSRFVWTVDYARGMLWIPDPDESEESRR